MKKALFVSFSFFILLFNLSPDNIVELNEGYLKLKVFDRTGAFCLYQLSTNGKNN